MSIVAQEDIDVSDLTQEQLDLLQEQRDLIKTNRETFKASLSAKQLAILENNALTKQERQKVLIKTFSEAQKKLLEDNKAKVRKLKARFRATLTLEQRQRIRSRLQTRNGEYRNRLRQSIRQNRLKRRQQNN